MVMRKSYYFVVLAVFMTMSFLGCSSEDYESSTEPRLRILGTWQQIINHGHPVASDSIYYTFTANGKLIITHRKQNNTEKLDDAIGTYTIYSSWTYEAVDNWTYDEKNEKTDEVIGLIDYTITNTDGSCESGGYKCRIGEKEMLWTGSPGVADLTCKFERR
jgi:hypothetical protein